MNDFINNAYCYNAGRATINYRTYSAGKIRYRYSNENWQEIDGDNYSLTETSRQCPGTQYVYRYGKALIRNGTLTGWREFTKGVSGTAPYSDIRFYINSSLFDTTDSLNPNLNHWGFGGNGNPPDGDRNRLYTIRITDSDGRDIRLFHGFSTGHKVFGLEPKYPEQAAIECPSDWEFIVTDCEGIIHQETRSEYPEIEVIQSQLLEPTEIIVNSIPQDFQIQVSNIGLAIDGRLSPPIGTINIPNHCLNIYKVNSSLFNREVNTVHNEHPLQLIKQVCSAKCSPPPEIEVTCEQQECPPNTCAVSCNGRICCYDRNGISIFSFPQ